MITSVGHLHEKQNCINDHTWNIGHIRSCNYIDLCNFNLLQAECEGHTKEC